MTDNKKTVRIATEIMEVELLDSNPSVIGDAIFNSRPSCFVNPSGRIAIVIDGSLYQDWSPQTRWDHAGMVEKKMGELGFWLELKSPFYPGQPYFAGFTPHNTTGWNGKPDNQMPGDTGPAAIFNAALAMLPEPAL